MYAQNKAPPTTWTGSALLEIPTTCSYNSVCMQCTGNYVSLYVRPSTLTHTSCTDVNTGVLTTFRSDNINGMGIGALVFATAVRVAPQTSISLARPTSTWDLSLRQKVYCKKLHILCKYWFRSCKMPCVSGSSHK